VMIGYELLVFVLAFAAIVAFMGWLTGRIK
jgi:hypothetical protein